MEIRLSKERAPTSFHLPTKHGCIILTQDTVQHKVHAPCVTTWDFCRGLMTTFFPCKAWQPWKRWGLNFSVGDTPSVWAIPCTSSAGLVREKGGNELWRSRGCRNEMNAVFGLAKGNKLVGGEASFLRWFIDAECWSKCRLGGGMRPVPLGCGCQRSS